MNKYLLICFFTIISLSICTGQQDISIQRIESLPSNATINDILVNDTLVYIAANTGLYEINSRTLEGRQLRQQSCEALCLGSKSSIFASFDNRFIENITTSEKTNYNSPGLIVSDIERYKGKVWIGSNQGILTVNTRTNAMTASKTDRNSDLPNQNIVFLHADNQDQMWIGTPKGIVLINAKEKWKTYEKKLSMEAMHYNHEGLWLVSNEEMWVVDPFNRWYPAAIDRGLREGNIRDITADSTGRLYMASDILVRYDPYNEEIESFKETPGLVSKQCSTVESDKDNRIWLGTTNSGLYLFGFKEEAKQAELSAICIIEKNIQCVGESASVGLSIYGGTAPYEIEWNDGLKNTKQRSLRPGEHNVQITDSEGKTVKTAVSIEEIEGMKLAVLETEKESRPGASDGRAKVLVSGGLPPYKISWQNGEKGAKAFNLKSGVHEVKVSDANNCNFITSIELKADKILPDLQITKIKVGQTLQINNLFFQADSTDVMSESYQVMDEIYDFLASNPAVVIEIGGHTNNIPTHEYCDKLSTARAKSVAYYLYNKGISEDRISYKGYGKRNPIASNKSLAGRKKNQRVEIKIMELAG